jgi:hypothetical protein
MSTTGRGSAPTASSAKWARFFFVRRLEGRVSLRVAGPRDQLTPGVAGQEPFNGARVHGVAQPGFQRPAQRPRNAQRPPAGLGEEGGQKRLLFDPAQVRPWRIGWPA